MAYRPYVGYESKSIGLQHERRHKYPVSIGEKFPCSAEPCQLHLPSFPLSFDITGAPLGIRIGQRAFHLRRNECRHFSHSTFAWEASEATRAKSGEGRGISVSVSGRKRRGEVFEKFRKRCCCRRRRHSHEARCQRSFSASADEQESFTYPISRWLLCMRVCQQESRFTQNTTKVVAQ